MGNTPPSIRKVSDLVHITVANTPTLIYTLSLNRTAKVKKVMLMNYTGANDFVTFGQGPGAPGPAFVAHMPAIVVVALLDGISSEWELPEYVFEADIYALVPAASGVAPATPVDVMIETEES